MYNINDKNTQSVAESVKEVIENKKDFKPHMMYDPETGKGYEAKTYEDHLKMKDMGYTHEKPSKKNETEVQDSDKDFVDTHTVDAKEDPEKKRQVEEKEEEDDDVEEGNAFGQAVTDAKKAGKKKFKFQGKEYKVESVDLGNFRDKDDYIVVIQGAGDNKQKIVQVFKGTQLDKAKKYKDDWNKKNANKIKKNKKGQPMAAHGARLYTHPADSTINGKPNIPKVGDRVSWSMFGQRVIKEAGQLKKDGYEVYESTDLEEATMSQGVKTAQTQIYSLEKSLKAGSNLNKGVNKSLEGKYDADFKKMEKAIGQIINVWEEIERDFSVNESAELEEALKPADFVKGGDAKVTKREVDGMLSKLFIDSKLAKAVEANAAYQDGYKGKVKNNPFKKDTADFHLFILGQQSADAE